MASFREILGGKPADTSKQPPKVRKFFLNRVEDESGVSGTGIVAVGVEFPSGRCVMEWVSKKTDANSLGIYDDIDDLQKVHGHGGKTEVKFNED